MTLAAALRRISASSAFRRIVPPLVLAVSILTMGRFALTQYGAIGLEVREMQPELVLLAFAAILAASAIGGIYWRVILSACGARVTLDEAMRSWCLSTPAKYGLGALTQYAGRVYLIGNAGISRTTALVGLALEVVVIVLSGVAVTLLLAPSVGWRLAPEASPALMAAAPLGAVALVAALPSAVPWAMRLLSSRLTSAQLTFAPDRLWAALAIVCLNWLLLGGASFLLVRSMVPVSVAMYPAFVVAVTSAMLAGMVGFTPLGLGVREVLMTLVLAQVVPAPVATSAAVLHRLLSVAAELLMAGAALVLTSPSAREASERK